MKERVPVVDYTRLFGADTWTVLMKNKGIVQKGSLISPFDSEVLPRLQKKKPVDFDDELKIGDV